MTSLQSLTDKIIDDFTLKEDFISRISDEFAAQAKANLNEQTERGIPMIPTYLTTMPNGSEKGTFLAADLGGTNFRVCSVELHGDYTFELRQEHQATPANIRTGCADDLVKFMANAIKDFLLKHHEDHFAESKKGHKLKMGFTFSFPVDQTSVNRGKLIRWTKGFTVDDLVGQDVCELLQAEMDKQELRVNLATLCNDTVGTLMARAYTNPSSHPTVMGVILGTGTNCAYMEKTARVPKYKPETPSELVSINTEWGSFDNDLRILPSNQYDKIVDRDSSNRSFHVFEKHVSGLYLGELLRLVIADLYDQKLLFQNGSKPNEALHTMYSTDTSLLSYAEEDESETLSKIDGLLTKFYGVESTQEERECIKRISFAIAKRSAYLAGLLIGSLLHFTGVLNTEEKVDVGLDGSVYEYYPNFDKMMREAMALTPLGKDVERVTTGGAKDGSGVGAALCALIAGN